MKIIGISEDSYQVLTKGIGADGEPIPKKLTPEQMREARAVTINRTAGEGQRVRGVEAAAESQGE